MEHDNSTPSYVVINPLHIHFESVPKRPKIIISDTIEHYECHVMMCYDDELESFDAFVQRGLATRGGGT